MNFETFKDHKGNEIDGPIIIKPNIFEDKRGYFFESWNSLEFNKHLNKKVIFLQDNHSRSKKGVLRGLHYQIGKFSQGKLVRCTQGRILDVFVDIVL